jgi:hypothetical protein
MDENMDESSWRQVAEERDEQGLDGSRARDAGFGSRDVSDEDVRNRAHEIYLRRGEGDGDQVSDWLEAEREVRGQSGGPRTPDDLAGGGAG